VGITACTASLDERSNVDNDATVFEEVQAVNIEANDARTPIP
jgi:hypothetical protein